MPSAAFAAYCSKPHLELTLSPSTNTVEVNWDLEDWQRGDTISIYLANVFERPGTVLPATVVKTDGHIGWKDTGVPLRVEALDISKFTHKCLKAYAIYWRNSGKKKESIMACCLQTLPDWMKHYKDKIRSKIIAELFLPGTHNSAAYKTDFPVFLFNKIKAMYLFNQDLSILQQLILGSRYLDIRISREKKSPYFNDEDWMLVHGSYRLTPVITTINDIKTFLNNTEYEVIILDIHKVDGLSAGDVMDFVEYLDYHLGSHWAAPKDGLSWQSPLQSFWSKKRRLVIGITNMDILLDPRTKNMLINPVYQLWVNSQTIKAMEGGLRSIFEKIEELNKPDYNSAYYYYEGDLMHNAMKKTNDENSTAVQWPTGWAVMAELTLSSFNIMFRPTQSLRNDAATVNPWLSRWFRRFSWGRYLCNIVAVDFLLGTGIVRAATDFNLMRASGKECYSYDDYKDNYTQIIYKA